MSSIIAWLDYFLLQICQTWVEKKTFFYFMAFNPFQAKKKQNIPIINVKTKAFLKKRH